MGSMDTNAEIGFLARNLDQQALKLEFRLALERVFADPDRISTLFTDDYVQTTDGSTSDRKAFEEHVRHVARVVRSIRFEVLDVVRQGDSIADRHRVVVVYQDGRSATIEVHLFGEIFGGRLRRVHELTRVVAGDESLKALGTAHD